MSDPRQGVKADHVSAQNDMLTALGTGGFGEVYEARDSPAHVADELDEHLPDPFVSRSHAVSQIMTD